MDLFRGLATCLRESPHVSGYIRARWGQLYFKMWVDIHIKIDYYTNNFISFLYT